VLPCGITDITRGKSHIFADAFVAREGFLKDNGRSSRFIEASYIKQGE